MVTVTLGGVKPSGCDRISVSSIVLLLHAQSLCLFAEWQTHTVRLAAFIHSRPQSNLAGYIENLHVAECFSFSLKQLQCLFSVDLCQSPNIGSFPALRVGAFRQLFLCGLELSNAR